MKKTNAQNKRRNTLLAIVLIIIMFGSVLGVVVSSFGKEENKQNQINYNNLKFIKQGDYWTLVGENTNFVFRYNPLETEEINVELNLLSGYYNKPLYIFSEDEQAKQEIYKNLFYYNGLVQRFQDACLEGEKCEGNFPFKNCQDNFIIIKRGESNIYQKENCVFIEGLEENLTKITDEFLFNLLDIRQ